VIRLVLRLLIVPIGIGFAGIAALVVGIAGAISSGYGGGLAAVAEATGLSIVMAAMTGADPSDLASFVALLWLFALGILFVPIAIVAIAGELFGVGSWLAYAFGCAAAFGLVPVLFPGDPATHGWPERAALGFVAMGLAAGSVYWLIAGRGAGRSRPSARVDDAGRLQDAAQPGKGQSQS
jgi:hypothetical protein